MTDRRIFNFIHYLALPYHSILVVSAGIVLSLVSWLLLVSEVTHAHFIASLKIALPWIILIGGILISFLISALVRLIDLTHERKQTLAVLNAQFAQEIAEKIQTQESKQNLEKALLQGQKLQAMGTLAGGIAHDFNNILYAIVGYVEMAREDAGKETLTYQNLGKVIEACHRGQDLIARILAFSRRQHHDFKPIPLVATIESILDLLRSTIPASVEIQFNHLAHDVMILGNQTQLHQVIVNIINNAVDAMDGEGLVTCQIEPIEINAALLQEYPKLQVGHYCKITITDTGHGMDPQTLSRIFEPFFTTKEVGKGTGLGLSTVHGIIEEHQGDIQVQSKLGAGTTFTVLLPEYIPSPDEKEQPNGENFTSRR